MNEIENQEIEGYIRRVKFLAPHEKSKADIPFYSKVKARKKAYDGIYQLAESKDGPIHTDNENIMRIASNLYKKLYTFKKVNEKVQHNLLRNIKTKLSKEQKSNLHKPITIDEVY